MRRFIAILIAACMLLAVLAGCGQAKAPETPAEPAAEPAAAAETDSKMTVEEFLARGITERKIQSVATGTSGGTQYVFISAIGNVINNKVDNLQWNMESSTGGVDNINQIKAGNFEFGFAEQSTANDFYNGTGDVPEAYPGLRAVFPCYTQDFLFSTVNENLTGPLADWSALDGKISGLGSVTGSLGQSINKLSNVFDLSKITFQNVTWSECFTMMAEGNFDYIFGIFGQPSSLVTEYNVNTSNPPMHHVELSDEIIDQIVAAYPFYSRTTLPGDMYTTFNGEDYHTYGCWAFVYCDKDMDNLSTYNVCKALFANKDELAKTLASFDRLTAESITNSVVPLQTGAIWYYEEQGIEIPAELYPEEYISLNDYVASLA